MRIISSRLPLAVCAVLILGSPCLRLAQANELLPAPDQQSHGPAVPLPAPATGEIQLRGRITMIDPASNRIAVGVTSFSLPNGRVSQICTPKEKTIILNGATSVQDLDGELAGVFETGPLNQSTVLQLNTQVCVTGADAGSGRPLAARIVAAMAAETDAALDGVCQADTDSIGAAPFVQQFTRPNPSPMPAPQFVPQPPSFSRSGLIMFAQGRMSTFGGPNDFGVGPSEGLAIANYDFFLRRPQYFLAAQPPGTTGLARRLNPSTLYVACRWDYSRTPKDYLANIKVTVINPRTGARLLAQPMDWGPHNRTNRIADLSPGLAAQLGLGTDDICRIEVPLP